MKKKDIKTGGHYTARVSGNIVTVRVDKIRDYTGWGGTYQRTVYDVTNLKTGRKTTFRSAQRFRCEAGMAARAKAAGINRQPGVTSTTEAQRFFEAEARAVAEDAEDLRRENPQDIVDVLPGTRERPTMLLHYPVEENPDPAIGDLRIIDGKRHFWDGGNWGEMR